MVNGAFFVPSGQGLEARYANAESVEPKSAGLIDQLTMNAGVLGGTRDNSLSISFPGFNDGGSRMGSSGDGGNGGNFFGMIFGSGGDSGAPSYLSLLLSSVFVIMSSLLTLDIAIAFK